MGKAIVAGHICIDITPQFPKNSGINISASDILKPGKLLNMEGVTISTGGAVANTGLAMKKLGADVSLMGKIGDDDFGRLLQAVVKSKGYDVDGMIVSKEAHTSYSIVLAIPSVDRIFLHDPGANNTFCYEDLNFAEIEKADLFHFGYPPLMKKIYENDGEELIKIFQAVKAMGLATSLDLAAVDDSSDAGKQDWRKILEKVIPYVDFFVPSVEELCYMLDRPTYDAWIERAGKEDVTLTLSVKEDIKPLADTLMELGAKVVLIKCGAPGLYYRSADKATLAAIGEKVQGYLQIPADTEGFERSFQPERVLSGTGAGDTAIAAFLTAILEGRAFQEAVMLSAATGSSCVESYDSLGGLKSFEELMRKIENGWERSH